jgi:hypothetical protein
VVVRDMEARACHDVGDSGSERESSALEARRFKEAHGGGEVSWARQSRGATGTAAASEALGFGQ